MTPGGVAWSALVGLGVLAASGVAVANMASPWQAGDVVAEPFGPLREMTITREELAIDLRPLASGALAQVTAVYHVESAGPAREATLVFVSAGVRGDGAVKVDGAAIPSRRIDKPELPREWRWPAGEHAEREQAPPGAFGFDVTLAPGKHEIAVTYAARAAAHHPLHEVYREHRVAYLLAPARVWGGFGRLEVRVTLPAGWIAECRPALARSGDVLAGGFDGIPADQLALAVRRPAPFGPVGVLPVVGAVLALGLVSALAWLVARKTRRVGSGVGFLVSVALTLVSGAAAATLTGTVGLASLELLDAKQVSRSWSYGHAGEVLLLTLGAGLAGLLLGGLVPLVARRRP